jgi:hypothetical protein
VPLPAQLGAGLASRPSFSYQWYKDDAIVSGATTNTYTPTVGEGTHSLLCRVTPTNAFGTATPADTAEAVVDIETAPLRTFKVSATDSAATYTTIAQVNAATFLPGDFASFKGGETFSGGPLIVPSSGDSSHRITFGSYGGGKATISSGTSKGAYALNKAYVDVRDLIFVGASNATHGVHFENDQAGNTTLAGPRLLNLDVSGYGWNGIFIQGTNGTSGFTGFRVAYCTAHDCTGGWATANGSSGIYIKSGAAYTLASQAHTSGLIEYCTAYGNTGKAGSSSWSGSGIIVSDSTNTTISHCTAYQNGLLGDASAGGPVGIWTVNSTGTTIADCTSYSNYGSASRTHDGGGFDLDGGAKDCTIERCLSYSNDGPAVLVYAYGDGLQANTGNVVRNNISINDDVQAITGALHVRNDAGPAMSVDFYHNTVYYPRGFGCLQFLRSSGCGLISSKIGNNVFTNTSLSGFCIYEDVDSGVSTNAGLSLKGNCYDPRGWVAYFGGATYRSVDGWLAAETGQERVSSVIVATSAAPKFSSPGGTTAAGMQLATGSPVADIGIDLSAAFSITPPTTDYFGTVRPASGVAMGAHEIAAQSTASEAEINATYTVSSTNGGFGNPVASPAILRDGLFTDPSSWVGNVGGSSSVPEWIVADVGSAKTLTAIRFAPRDTSISLRGAEVEVSSDGSTWTLAGRLYGLTNGAITRFPVGSRVGRYVRIIKRYDSANATYENTLLSAAEFRLYGILTWRATRLPPSGAI